MIDIHDATVSIHDANLTGGMPAAVRATTGVLADCWDDCAAAVLAAERSASKTFPPDGEPGNWQAMNPYRLATDITPPAAPADDRRYADWQDVTVTDEMRDAMEGKSNPERDDRLRHVFITSTDDAELIAMQIIVQALEGLEPPMRQRIIRYVGARIA